MRMVVGVEEIVESKEPKTITYQSLTGITPIRRENLYITGRHQREDTLQSHPVNSLKIPTRSFLYTGPPLSSCEFEINTLETVQT